MINSESSAITIYKRINKIYIWIEWVENLYIQISLTLLCSTLSPHT